MQQKRPLQQRRRTFHNQHHHQHRLLFFWSRPILLFLQLISIFICGCCCLFIQTIQASDQPPYSCTKDSECEKFVGQKSKCIFDSLNIRIGKCNNPFQQGCLKAYKEGWTKLRTCNSEDPMPDAVESGLCRIPDFTYQEVRIFGQNWESAMFESWILQIVLSEVLDVPTTVETGFYDLNLNFYDPTMPFDYGGFNDWSALKRAYDYGGDCTLASSRSDAKNYESCAHIIPEVWHGLSHTPIVQSMTQDGILEPPIGLGAIGKQDWYIPKFVAQNDPSLLSYLGLMGSSNRQKLAETFLRPTTWGDYCTIVSTSNCSIPDNVAIRAPQSQMEAKRMFVIDKYTGHFRKTDKNDCNKNPTTCTGHIADYPCGWTSFVKPQTYHLDIALESDGNENPYSKGYEYSQLVEMWHAANYTKSPLIMVWWEPEALYQDYIRTDAEFTKITLPPPTQECWTHSIVPEDRCVEDFHTRIGDSRGACEEVATPLHKEISRGLALSVEELAKHGDVDKSPAYDAIHQFTIAGLQMGEMFEYWKSMSSPREAICQWTVDNLDYLISTMVPNAYPRVVIETNDWSPLFYASIILGSVSTILVLVTSWMVFQRRKKRAMKFAQVEFLMILLLGLCIISVGAVIVGFPPSDASCVASIWLINLGYTLELVPLIVKVAAINRLMLAARNMRRVVLRRDNLFGAVIVISACVVIYLITWTAVDPPHKVPEYVLTDETTESNEAVVTSVYYCSSNSSAWEYGSLAWNVLLLICATVLAFQTRKVIQDFNESQTLAIMIYSHFVFVVLRVITFLLSSSGVSQAVLSRCRSLIYSADTIITILIYFWPKFAVTVQSDRQGRSTNLNLNDDSPSASGTMMMMISNPVFRLLDQVRSRTTSSAADGRPQTMTILEAEATDGRELDDDDVVDAAAADGNNIDASRPASGTAEVPQRQTSNKERCYSVAFHHQSPQHSAETSSSNKSSAGSTRSKVGCAPSPPRPCNQCGHPLRPCSQCGHVELQPLLLKDTVLSFIDSHDDEESDGQ